MSYLGPCYLCGESVDTTHGVAYPIKGWEELREQGGANRIIGRKRIPNVVAHVRCVEKTARKEREGVSPEQETLL